MNEWTIHRSVYTGSHATHIHIHKHTEDLMCSLLKPLFSGMRMTGTRAHQSQHRSPGLPGARPPPSHLHLLGLRPLAQALQQVLATLLWGLRSPKHRAASAPPCTLPSLSASVAPASASLHPPPESLLERETGGWSRSPARLCEGNS